MKYLSFSIALMSGFLVCAFPAYGFAGLILDAEVRVTYEDNVNGLLSDQRVPEGGGSSSYGGMAGSGVLRAGEMGGLGPGNGRYTGISTGSSQSPGDFSATFSAQVGGYSDVGRDSLIFAKGFAEHSSYNTYTDLDATIGGVSTGVNTVFGGIVSGGASVFGKIKQFGDSVRNSKAYGGTLSLKQKFSPSFWLREFGDYEKNIANDSFYNYAGTRIGASVGYAPARNTRVLLGYSYLVRKYEEPAGSDLKAQTGFFDVEQALGKFWTIAGEYDLQISKESITGTSMTNNIFSLALRYSY